MSKLKIVTQTDNIEGKKTKVVTDNWMDDCAWATLACAANHLTGTKYTSFDGVKWGEAVGRKDRDGLPDPSSLAQLVKAGPLAGLKVTYPKTWADVEKALGAGAVILVNVEQAKGYPPVTMSKWHVDHQKRKPGSTYGHMTCAAKTDEGIFWADPTMSGKGKEVYGVPVTLQQLKQIASSKGDAPHKRCLIARKK
jgi:hypothetical protein